MDFQLSTTELIFPVNATNGTEMCFNISIADDDRVEYDETFSITLTVDNPLDTINGGNTTLVIVTILDNDGTYMLGPTINTILSYIHMSSINHTVAEWP